MKSTRNRISLFFIVGIVSLFQPSWAGTFKFERFSNREGFNQNSINTIEQDRYGFLWFGTPNGLIKYDGYQFQQFTSNDRLGNSISNNMVSCLYNDENGLLWISNRLGVDVYIPWLEKFVPVPLGEAVHITHIDVDKQGHVWISGTNSLFKCELGIHENEISFNVSNNLLEAFGQIPDVNGFYFTDSNSILLATMEGLTRLEIEDSDSLHISSSSSFPQLENTNVNAINKIKNIYWIGTSNGLFKSTFEGNRLHIISHFKSTDHVDDPVLDILSIYEDSSGNVWLGTRNDGLYRYILEEDIFDHYPYDPKNGVGITSSQINCIYQDNFGVIWIGTAQGGVNKLDLIQKPFINYAHNPFDYSSISGNLVNGILEDRQGKVWISSYSSLCRSINVVNEDNIDKLQFESLEHHLPFPENTVVTKIFEDNRGYIWICSSEGLVLYNPKSQSFNSIELMKGNVKVSVDRCNLIAQIENDKIIIGTDKVMIVEKPWEQLSCVDVCKLQTVSITDLGESIIQSFYTDNDGSVWFGTSNGLVECDYVDSQLIIKNHFSQGNDNFSLSDNNVFSLHKSRSAHLWIGTFGGGLNKMSFNEDGEVLKIERLRKNNVLPDDAVYGIIQEDDDHFWLSTDMGLCKLNIHQNTSEVFDVRDGLPNNNFRKSAYHKGNSGYFYFGGLNGLTIFKPEEISLNEVPPEVLITKLWINNKLVQIGVEQNGKVILARSVSDSKEIAIGPEAKTIAFEIVVQHNSTPAKNSLEYMLEGFDNQWIASPSGKTTVTYTALPPDEYTFKIKAANGDGLWNNETTNMSLRVYPPWYQTWWSYTIFILVLAGVIVGIFSYFIQLEKLEQKIKYEQIDKQRMDSINQGKFRFFTNISHEFRTPLALISGPLERIISENTDTGISKYLSIIQNNTKRLLNLVDQLLAFRQAEQGHMKLHISRDTLGNYIYPVTEAFEEFAKHKNINFFYKVNSPNEEVEIDQEKTERIIFNLLSNSFKHTPEFGNISIEAEVKGGEEQKMVVIKVNDNGEGIQSDKLELIFERFYHLEGKEEHESGTGIGLAFCKSLIDLMGGEISVESKPKERTCFTVLIPAKSEEHAEIVDANAPAHSFIKNWMPFPVESPTVSSKANSNGTDSTLSLLIIDDEADVRDFLLSSLGEKYEIELAENGLDGLEKIKQKEPDLIICDVMMPAMDGMKFCKKVKSENEICHIPIILLTALTDDENTIRGLECGADDYISKPFSLRHLELKVEKLIENNIRIKAHFSKNSVIPENSIDITGKDKEFLERIINAIEENLADSRFGVEELAREIGLSSSQFYRRLKQLTGQIPNAYLRNYRLQKAAQLLSENNGYNVAEVMYQIGIESNSYFSTSFKKLHGCSPSDFLRKSRPLEYKGQ